MFKSLNNRLIIPSMSKKIIILFVLTFFNNNIGVNSEENSSFFDLREKIFEKKNTNV